MLQFKREPTSFFTALTKFEFIAGITAQKMKFAIKTFFSKCDQICIFVRIWSHLLNESLKENFIFVQCEILFYRLLHPVAGIADKFVVYILLRYGKLPWISLNVIPSNIITTIIIVKWF